MIFKTISGSQYDLDQANKRIRRLSGAKAPSARQGEDGEWRTYRDLVPEQPKVDQSLIIIWEYQTKLIDGQWLQSIGKTTMTSTIAEIEPEILN